MITAAELFDYLKITREIWVTATVYEKGVYKTNGSTVYECMANHTSGTFATDLANGLWTSSHFVQACADYAISRVNNFLNRDCRSGSYTDKFEGDGTNYHWLKNPPGSAVASIKVRDESTGEYTTIFTGSDTVGNSIELGSDGKLELLKGYSFSSGSRYEVAYTGGYTSVPELIKGACKQLGAIHYKESPAGTGWLAETSRNLGGQSATGVGLAVEQTELKVLKSIEMYRIINV